MTGSIHDTDRTRFERQLVELADRAELTDLVARLARWLDERAGQPRAIFTGDASADTPGGRVQGIDRVVEQAIRNHTPDRRHQHLLTNVLVELDGDRAAVGANMLVSFAPNTVTPGVTAPGVTYQLGGRYRFEATRTPDGWRLSRVSMRPLWSSGSPPVVTPSAPATS